MSLLNNANVDYGSDIEFAVAIGSISIFASLCLSPPYTYSFWFFPFDFAMFVCWMVLFGLLMNVRDS
jgi:hypothetical protein